MVGSEWHSNPAFLNASSGGAGYVTNIGGLDSYVTGSHLALAAVVLISDVFGFKAQLFRLLADKIADNGYFVVAPDFFNGDPFDSNDVNRPLDVWLQDHDPEKGFEAAKPVIEDLRSKGFSTFGVGGFCWGGKTASDLGRSELVEATVLLHPAYVEVDDIRGMKTPIAILGGQNDTITPPSLIKQFEKVLKNAKHKVDFIVKIFPGASHGWTVRYDPNDPKAVKLAERAHKIMIGWFDKHLKN